MTSAAKPPTLYLVTDRHSLGGSDRIQSLVDFVAEAASAGIDLIQIREKDLTGRKLFELTDAIVKKVRPLGARVLVNDRIDIAIACDADGVHLASNSIPVEVAMSLLGKNKLLGISTHSLSDVKEAERGGADFVVFGPIFETPSKMKYGPPVGLDSLSEVAANTKLPLIAIGGITEENYHNVLTRGANGIAAIKMFSESDSLSDLVRRLKTTANAQ